MICRCPFSAVGLAVLLAACSDGGAVVDLGADDALPDPGCIRLVPLGSGTREPAVASLLVAAERCASGQAVRGLVAEDLALAEEGVELGSDVHRVLLPRTSHRAYVTLLLDAGEGTDAVKRELLGAAGSFVRTVLSGREDRVRVGVRLFDGGTEPIAWQLPLGSAERLGARLDDLERWGAPAPEARNLYGALRAGIEALRERQVLVRVHSAGGVATSGHLVVFTAGGDDAGHEVGSRAQHAVRTARAPGGFAEAAPSVTTWGLALAGEGWSGEDLGLLLGGEAPDGSRPRVVEAQDGAGIGTAFSELSRRIGARIDATYALAVCSPAREGEHTVTVEARDRNGPPGEAATFTYAADGFSEGCHSTFLGHACDGTACGGLLCGACDDEAETCDGSRGRCVDNCADADPCGEQGSVNPLGYEQGCDVSPGMRVCDGVCTDTLADDANCGFCGVACEAPGSRCDGGGCVCPGEAVLCLGECVLTDSDPRHCGGCDRGCDPDWESCRDSVCVCRAGDADGDGLCDDADDDDDDDGCPDEEDEAPRIPAVDTDGDGRGDDCDLCAGADESGDSDGDGTCDDTDDDDDDDGCADGADPAPTEASEDLDGDGVPADCDRCPAGAAGEDADGDGVPDVCDRCADGDDTVDTDGDGNPDDCDPCLGDEASGDLDRDGTCDDTDPDDDADGCPDDADSAPRVPSPDSDGDGVADHCDRCPDAPDGEDADGDGVPDACDECAGDDASGDTDGDGTCDDEDDDDDDDGCRDRVDAAPLVASGDADGDGLADDCDPCHGEEDPECFCAADGYEDNDGWQQAIGAAERFDGDIGTVDDLTLMEGDTDWYAFDVPAQNLNVTATVEVSDHCQGDVEARVCVDVSVYSDLDEFMGAPPRHLGGPYCGSVGDGVASERLSFVSMWGEEWTAIVVQVYPEGDPAGPAPYDLLFTH